MPAERDEAPLEIQVWRLASRLQALERELRLHARRLEQLGRAVDALRIQDEVEAGVRKALAGRQEAQADRTAAKVRERGVPFTWPQRIGAAAAAAIIVLDAVRGLLH